MHDWNLPPQEIERMSFKIIDQEAGDHGWPRQAWAIVRRMIHTTADFDYVHNVRMHPEAIAAGRAAIAAGCTIYTDTTMAASGISARRLQPHGAEVRCLINDPTVAQRAKEAGTTRSYAAVDQVHGQLAGNIYVVGNAPTALLRLAQHVASGQAQPALVVGLPVGFVNAAESKEAILEAGCPYITALGRKGGSAVAASVINALAELGPQGV